MESDATDPPEQALTEALLSLSWPLPRTVEDADAALTRLEEVRAVLVRLEQQSVGTEVWWAGPVDALATQSGFVLEWWRPVLRDPDLDWSLNHQAHLTADLATLASAGARLLDQMEPRAAQEAAAVHARRAAQERRWGPSALPPLAAAAAAGGDAPGARPQPPSALFGPDVAGAEDDEDAAAAAAAQRLQRQRRQPSPGAPSAEDLEPPQFPPLPADPRATQPPPPEALNAGAARHRRPSYDFDDPETPGPAPVAPVPAASGQGAGTAPARPPAPPLAPGPAPHGPAPAGLPGPRGPLQQDPYPAPPPSGPPGQPDPGFGPGYPHRPAHGYPDEPDEDEPRLVPTGLRRHQRRLLLQTAAILVAIAVLCWWAVYTLSSNPSHPAAGSASASGQSTAQAGAGVQGGTGAHSSPASSAPATSQSPKTPATSPAPAPSTATSSVADGATVSSVQVTLLGGSGSVPQIVALITVHTAGTGPVNVTGGYYGAAGGRKLAPETDHWVLSGHTSYQYSVPIANSPYCASTFHFTLSAGGMTDSGATSPGC